jgi:hypothetical protein
MSSAATPHPEDARRDDTYEPPRVEDLGTFTELTQHRLIPRVTDNTVNLGSR